MELGLAGKNILVTGAAKGIGRQIALAAAEEGANIALHYHTSAREANQTAKEIEALGVKTVTVSADISKLDDVAVMKDVLDKDFGHIDYIVNNAGWAQAKSFFKYEHEEWKRENEVCFYGVINLAYTFVPDMINKKKGKFINIIGDSARSGDRNLIVSAASRSGATSFLKSLAQEVGPHHVTCNTVSLGLIDKGNPPFNEDTMQKLLKSYPLRRLGKAGDVSGAVLFLLSYWADWITGQVLSVNGGYIMP